MSIASELESLISNTAAIKTAIVAKNPSVQPSGGLSTWPASIASISGGGSKPEQSKTVTPTAAGLTVTPDTGYALSSVIVNGDADLVASNVKSGVEIFGVTGSLQPAKQEQSKTVTPTAAGLTVTPDTGKVLSSVVVNGDADLVAGNIKKDVNIFGVTGNVVQLNGSARSVILDDKAGDTFYPESGKNAITSIAVTPNNLPVTITPTPSSQTKYIPLGYSGYGTITVDAVTSSIDSNIQEGNIKSGIKILGVTGSLQPAKEEQSKTVTPTAAGLTVTPDSGKVLSSVVVNGDADLVAGNIKKDVNIFGVTGSYEGGGGLQGHTLTIENYGSEVTQSPIIIYYADGTSESVRLSPGTYTYHNVVYVYCNIIVVGTMWYDTDGDEAHYPQSMQYILITEDKTLYYNTLCLLKGSLVSMWDGTTKRIEDVTYDDELLCWDFDNGRFAHARPLWVKRAQIGSFYWVNRFDSGREVLTTGTRAKHGHRFFNIRKGSFAHNTECVGEDCYTLDGPSRLAEARYIEEECEFYNVITKYHMNMFVNGVLTSCRYNNIYPVKDMRFVIDHDRKPRSREEFVGIPDDWFVGLRCSEQVDLAENISKYVSRCEALKKAR